MSGHACEQVGGLGDVLDVARREFAENGFSAARIDRIALGSHGGKHAIYTRFSDKGQLYSAVLSGFYQRLRRAERDVLARMATLGALDAIRAFVGFNYDWHLANEDGVRLTVEENIHRARHLADPLCRDSAKTASLDVLDSTLSRGAADGSIRGDVDPLQLYLSITALCFFNVSNRYTVNATFGRDAGDPAWAAQRRDEVIDIVIRSLLPFGARV